MLFSLIVVGTCLYLYSLRGLDVPLSGWIRSSLVGARLVFLLALLWLMTLPQTRDVSTLSIPPSLFVVLDDSSSMQMPLGGGETPSQPRWDAALESLQSPDALPALEDRGFPLSVATLSDGGNAWSARLPLSASPVYPRTNLARSVYAWAEASPEADASYLLLVTDGQYNEGESPKEAWDRVQSGLESIDTRRVYTLGIGPVLAPYDLAIDAVEISDPVRPEQPFEVTVQVLVQGQASQAMFPLSLLVRTETGDQLLQREAFIETRPDESAATATLQVEGLPSGNYIIEASIPSQPNELSSSNNMKDRGLRIDEALDPVLVLTGGPNWDFKFMKRMLEDEPELDMSAWLVHDLGLTPLGDRGWVENRSEATGSAPQDIYSLSELIETQPDWSAVVLHNMRYTANDLPFAEWLADYVSNGGGVLVLPGNHSSLQLPSRIAEVLPAPLTASAVYQDSPISILPDQVQVDTLATTLQRYEALPPLPGIYRLIQAAMTSRPLVMAQVFGETPMPVVQETRTGLGTVIHVLADQLHRLKFVMQDSPLRSFWLSLIYQCNNRLQPRSGQITTDAYFYEALSPVAIQYQSRDRIQGASGTVPALTVAGPSGEERIWLSPLGDGRFDGTYTPVQPGLYSLQETISGASTSIRVGTGSQESANLQQNVSELRALADASGGRYANLPAWQELLGEIPFQSRVIEEERLLFIGERWWVGSLLILFLAIEWFIRWRKGLP